MRVTKIVISMVNITINRAVHLARRDAHYRLCVRLLRESWEIASVVRRRKRIHKILNHTQEAYSEALYALRGYKKSRAEKHFVKYLDLMYDAAKAAGVMVQHEALIKEDKSFLNQFLGTGAEMLGQFEEFEKRHGRMVREILRGMSEIASLARTPYRRLHRANIELLSHNDHLRYRSAYKAVISGGM